VREAAGAAPGGSPAGGGEEPWQLRLYRRSIKKKETLQAFLRLLPDPAGLRCLEVGCGSGTSSWWLRRRGGRWVSTDSDPEAVEAARALLGSGVCRTAHDRLPFADGAFELVLAINLIRDQPDDLAFARELARVLRPGGRLLVNCPEGSPDRPARRLWRLYGFSAERLAAYGDARDGYRREEILELIGAAGLAIERVASYSGVFTEVVENTLKYLYYRMERRKPEVAERHPAGTWNVGASHFRRIGWKFRALEAGYPLLRGLSLLDRLIPFREGYMLCLRARKPAA
jgi:SAM-dependent methyltransferase